MGRPRIDNFEGQRFGRLLATKYVGKTSYHCVCDCGNETTVVTYHLKSGNTKSCGCLHLEMVRAQKTTHGMSGTQECEIWAGMLKCCKNPSDKNYGGRGITVDERWNDFETFFRDMGPRPSPSHSIDRKDNNKGYSPENCRWATRQEQNNNTRANVFLEHNGQRKTVTQWAKDTAIARRTLQCRLERGLPVSEALSPIIRGKNA
jgi:hypothetical protein